MIKPKYTRTQIINKVIVHLKTLKRWEIVECLDYLEKRRIRKKNEQFKIHDKSNINLEN